MMTLQDILEKEFDKSIRGYRPEQVHEFLSQVAAYTEQLINEKADVEKKLYILAEKIEEYRSEEDMLKTAMINAQRMGESVIREAKQKADRIVREADLKANLIDEKAKEKLAAEQEIFLSLQAKIAAFKGEVLGLYKQHIESLSELPVIDEDLIINEIENAGVEENLISNFQISNENNIQIKQDELELDIENAKAEMIIKNSIALQIDEDFIGDDQESLNEDEDLEEDLSLENMPEIAIDDDDDIGIKQYVPLEKPFAFEDVFSQDNDNINIKTEEIIEKPPLRSSMFDNFEGINFKN